MNGNFCFAWPRIIEPRMPSYAICIVCSTSQAPTLSPNYTEVGEEGRSPNCKHAKYISSKQQSCIDSTLEKSELNIKIHFPVSISVQIFRPQNTK